MTTLDLERFRNKLKEKGITQRDLAAKLGKSESHLNRKLNGWLSMSVDEALTLFDLSGENINDYKK